VAVSDRALLGGVGRRLSSGLGRRRFPVRRFLDSLGAIATPLAFAIAVALASDGLKWG